MSQGDALATGDIIHTIEQMDELPIGSLICETNREQNSWLKMDDGRWAGQNGLTGRGPYDSTAFSVGGYNKVLNRAGGPPPIPDQETLRQFQWKFRENAIAGASENGVSMDACMKGLRLLGIDEPFPLGPGVKFKSLDNQLTFPAGLVVANALPQLAPSHANYTLFAWKPRLGWRAIVGRAGMARDVVVVQHPEVEETPEWWAEVGTEQSRDEVLQFKARAWRISTQIKSEQSWCGTLEHVIARVGVTHRSIREAQNGGFSPVDRVGQRDCAGLAEGSLLFYQDGQYLNQWAVYERDDTSDNLTRTRRIAGHRNEYGPALGHYHATMLLITTPTEGLAPRTVDGATAPQVLSLLPVGTVFAYGGQDRYIICRDRLCMTHRAGTIPNNGSHRPDVFRHAPVTIIEFQEQ